MTIGNIFNIVGPASPFVLILIYFVCYPDKFEIWVTLLYRFLYWLTKHGSKQIIKHDIQGRINEFSRVLGTEIANYEPVGISIEWVKATETAENFFKDNKVVIRMRHHEDQDKNFVIATMAFVSQSILRKAKKYLSPSQKESIDLYVCKKLCQYEKPRVEEKFFDFYLGPKTDASSQIRDLLSKYEIIDKLGMFYPVLVQELNFLGEKVFSQPRNSRIVEEVVHLINFLEQYAKREVGDETVESTFEGTYCRCGIMIVGKRYKVQDGDTSPYIKYVDTLFKRKLENIYLIAPALTANELLVNEIALEVQEKYGYLEYFSKEYKATILISGERVEVKNYLVLIRSSKIIRFYDKEIEGILFGK